MNAQLCCMLGYILCYRYHVGSIITLFLTIGQAQLINWTNFILDIVTNCIEVSLSRASYSLWTNLAKKKSGISKCLILEYLDNVLQ